MIMYRNYNPHYVLVTPPRQEVADGEHEARWMYEHGCFTPCMTSIFGAGAPVSEAPILAARREGRAAEHISRRLDRINRQEKKSRDVRQQIALLSAARHKEMVKQEALQAERTEARRKPLTKKEQDGWAKMRSRVDEIMGQARIARREQTS